MSYGVSLIQQNLVHYSCAQDAYKLVMQVIHRVEGKLKIGHCMRVKREEYENNEKFGLLELRPQCSNSHNLPTMRCIIDLNHESNAQILGSKQTSLCCYATWIDTKLNDSALNSTFVCHLQHYGCHVLTQVNMGIPYYIKEIIHIMV